MTTRAQIDQATAAGDLAYNAILNAGGDESAASKAYTETVQASLRGGMRVIKASGGSISIDRGEVVGGWCSN